MTFNLLAESESVIQEAEAALKELVTARRPITWDPWNNVQEVLKGNPHFPANAAGTIASVESYVFASKRTATLGQPVFGFSVILDAIDPETSEPITDADDDGEYQRQWQVTGTLGFLNTEFSRYPLSDFIGNPLLVKWLGQPPGKDWEAFNVVIYTPQGPLPMPVGKGAILVGDGNGGYRAVKGNAYNHVAPWVNHAFQMGQDAIARGDVQPDSQGNAPDPFVVWRNFEEQAKEEVAKGAPTPVVVTAPTPAPAAPATPATAGVSTPPGDEEAAEEAREIEQMKQQIATLMGKMNDAQKAEMLKLWSSEGQKGEHPADVVAITAIATSVQATATLGYMRKLSERPSVVALAVYKPGEEPF